MGGGAPGGPDESMNFSVVLSAAKDLIAAGHKRTLKPPAMRSFAALRMTREMPVGSVLSQSLRGARAFPNRSRSTRQHNS
jgi:hypothetical protein